MRTKAALVTGAGARLGRAMALLPMLLVAAAIRRHAEVALGNVIGSNMFNLLAIIGISTFFGEIPVAQSFLTFDLWVMLGASAVLAPFVLGRVSMSRSIGAILTTLYIVYVLVVLL